MKLDTKNKNRKQVKKIYDTPKTPYQRVLESSFIAEEVKKIKNGV